MNITKVQCPSCGANLEVKDASQSMIYCQSCGSPIYLETAHSTGYDMEMGRLNARGATADKLAETLSEMKEPVLNLPLALNQEQVLIGKIHNGENAVKSYENSKGYFPYIFPSIAAILLLIILSSVKAPFLVFVIAAICLIVAYPISGNMNFKRGENLKLTLQNDNASLVRTRDDIARFKKVIDRYPDVKIPPKYRTEKALNYFITTFKARQAFTLEEAYGKYDEVQKQEEFIAMQRQQIELQRQQIQQLQMLQQQNNNNRRRR